MSTWSEALEWAESRDAKLRRYANEAINEAWGPMREAVCRAFLGKLDTEPEDDCKRCEWIGFCPNFNLNPTITTNAKE